MRFHFSKYIHSFILLCFCYVLTGQASVQCRDLFVFHSSSLRIPLESTQIHQSKPAGFRQQMVQFFQEWVRQTFLLDTKQKHQRLFDERRERLLLEQKHLQAGISQRFGSDWKTASVPFVHENFVAAKNKEPRLLTDTETVFLQAIALENTLEFQFLTVVMKNLQNKIDELSRQIQSLNDSQSYLENKKSKDTSQNTELQTLQKKREDLEKSKKSTQQQLQQDELLLERIKPLREELFNIANAYDDQQPALHLKFILNKSVDDIVFDKNGKMIPDVILKTLHW